MKFNIAIFFLLVILLSHSTNAFSVLTSITNSEVPFTVNVSCSDSKDINYISIKNPDSSIRHLYKYADNPNFTFTLYEQGIYTVQCITIDKPRHFGTHLTISPEKIVTARLPTRKLDIPLSGEGTLKLTIRDENTIPFTYEDNVRFSIENTFHQNVRYNPIGGSQTLNIGTRAQNRITITNEGYPVTTRDFIVSSETLTSVLDLRLLRTTTPEGGVLIVNVFNADGGTPLPTARVSLKYGNEWIAKDIQPKTPIPNLIIGRTYTLIVEADGMTPRTTPVPLSAKENVRNVYLISDEFQL